MTTRAPQFLKRLSVIYYFAGMLKPLKVYQSDRGFENIDEYIEWTRLTKRSKKERNYRDHPIKCTDLSLENSLNAILKAKTYTKKQAIPR